MDFPVEQRLSLYLPIVLLNRPGRLDPGRNNLRLFTIKCLQNCPKVAMLYNSRKTGVQIGNQIVDIFQTNMQANQGPAKIDLALWRRYVLVDLPGSTIHTRPTSRPC